MATEADLLGTFEVHSPDDLESILAAGIRADQRKKTVDCLIEGYLRSARFTDCLRIMLTSGAEVGDPFLKRVCSDDALGVEDANRGVFDDTHTEIHSLNSVYVTGLQICATTMSS